VLLGEPAGTWRRAKYLAVVTSGAASRPVDLKRERALHDGCGRRGRRLVASAHDARRAVSRSPWRSAASRFRRLVGATVALDAAGRLDALLFGEARRAS